jgi:hypothetical protein
MIVRRRNPMSKRAAIALIAVAAAGLLRWWWIGSRWSRKSWLEYKLYTRRQ